ncbi:MAG: hypothetical protein A2857_00570 [Candidatus Levybacteria bacterium RIFCSPHIGHO2_01_FULL_36_15]|nr:MAG: hypothetical protein A2857_00570 [Candidatus Levybacteria bacterium RIFCSPHIGHO2_01_FULL_36_15]OGH38865.1 MAG: hypothetical protein A2905_05500 [Candidatus Levybacteria bacterium RIFCSPLOWO2_01_FULL_36_10]
MKQFIIAIVSILIIVSFVVVLLTERQTRQEEQILKTDLQYTSILIAESLKDVIEPYYPNASSESIKQIAQQFIDKEKAKGIVIYDSKNEITLKSLEFPSGFPDYKTIAIKAMRQNKNTDEFIQYNNKNLYLLAIPLHSEFASSSNRISGALITIQDASYIDTILQDVWKDNMMHLAIYSLIISLTLILMTHWIFSRPIIYLVELIKKARIGKIDQNSLSFNGHFIFQPLIN